MSAQHSAQFLPMKTAGTHHFIERTYREGSEFQWVRETLKNCLEASASRIEFGIEWQAVENKGIYRRLIADDGCGMNAEQLVEFFNTFGGGGKPIGGAHENFGVGSKTSLLPWNQYGMVVISWVDGDASMIWVTRDSESDEYGLKQEQCIGPNGELTREPVYDPYDDPDHGCDWASVKPDWLTDHGTVIVLLGNNPTADTVEGDPNRGEADIKGISSFLNRRMWTLPDGVKVSVDELRTNDRSSWPTSEAIAHGMPSKTDKDRRTNTRKIEGARHYIEYPEGRVGHGDLGARGTVSLKDGTEIDWYLWEGPRPAVQSYAALNGYIATLYDDELYDIGAHHSTYRSFGISDSVVRTRLWLIIRPLVDKENKYGVYPKTDRSSLLIKGGPKAGTPLPINDWAGEFADKMPAELLVALSSARQGDTGSLDDDEWRDKLAERFGARWRIPRLMTGRGGEVSSDPEAPPPRKSKRLSDPDPQERAERAQTGLLRVAKPGTASLATPSSVGGGLPRFRTVGANDVGPGMLAAWDPKDPKYPEGCVLINIDHPVLQQVIQHWQANYADHYAELIAKDVITVYGQVAVTKIAHSERLKDLLSSPIVETQLRSEEALTMSLLGLMAEDYLIATRVGGKYSKRRHSVADRPRAQRPSAPR